jgi:hypothetical protein
MKKRFIPLVIGFLLGITGLRAETVCSDLNAYVSSKNTADTGFYTLNTGYEEMAAQTYHFHGVGKVSFVRIYGNSGGGMESGVPLRVSIYNVDANGRPTSAIQSTNTVWWWYRNTTGYLDVYFSEGGVNVSNDFAVEVELRRAWPWGNSFKVQYTGNGEGRGADLASLAGTSTGGNWASAMTDFNRDGDFYLVPDITHDITAGFSASASCVAAGTSVSFTNQSQLCTDSMFNKIAWSGYTGSQHYYEWDFGDGSPKSNALSPAHTYTNPGVYTVSLTTTLVGWQNTCTRTKTMQVSVGLAAGVSNITGAACFNQSNGSALAVGSGGAGSYTYSLNGLDYSANDSLNGLAAGTYTLYIQDALGCQVHTSFTVTQPNAITFLPSATTNASCGHSDGSILVIGNGGTGSLSYKLNTGAYQSNGSFSNLSSGVYTITAKDSNGCTASALVSVNDAGGPVLSVTSTTNVSCNGASDGSIILNATGGSGVLQYSIDGGHTFKPSGSFTNIDAGKYAVVVKDATGCSQSTVIDISEPDAITFGAYATPATCHGASNGQVYVVNAIGGTGAFSYSLNGVSYQSNPHFAGLAAGTYTVYVKDVASCRTTKQVTVTEPTAINAVVTPVAATCNGSYDGTLTVTATGGNGEYMYGLNGHEYNNYNVFTDLQAGTYQVTVRDQKGCLYTTSATVTQPTAVTATITTTNSTCGNSNGGILAVASGGTGSGYQYSIDNVNGNSTGSFTGLASGTYYVIVADGAGCGNIYPATIADANGPTIVSSTHTNVSCHDGDDGTISITSVTGGTGALTYTINGANWQSSPVFTGLTAATYVVTVKDANGCTGSITYTVTQPNAFIINPTVTNNICFGDNSGTVSVFAAGGAGVFAYSIDNGTFQSSNLFNGLKAGAHSIAVRDGAGCYGYVTVDLTQPAKLNLSDGVLNVSCNGANDGVISLVASGGTGAYQFSIDGDNYAAGNVFLHLSGGLYNGYVKDANGCVTEITFPLYEPQPLVLTPVLYNVSCAGGNNGYISLNVTGGTGPYSYVWSNGSTYQDIFNLPADTYSVKVIDDHACIVTADYIVSQPASPLIVNGVITNATSATSNDGKVDITITGGVQPYHYSWSNGAETQDISNVAPGTYTVNIEDANNCVTSGVFTVDNLTGLQNLALTNNNIRIYPNPASNVATVETDGVVINSIKVMDVNGKVVMLAEPKQPKVYINADNMASGVYVVEVLVDGTYTTQRMIISK